MFLQDLSEDEQAHWATQLVIAAHHHCMTPVERACWDLDVPKTYIKTTNDVALPEMWQDAMIEPVKDSTWTVETVDSSHSPFLSRIDQLIDILVKSG